MTMSSTSEDKRFGLFDPDDIEDLIPSNAIRVRIQNANNQEKWRNPNDFHKGDRVIIENGEPRCMYSKPGRKSKKEEVEEFIPGTTEDAKDLQEEKRKFLNQDELLKLAKENPNDDGILDSLIAGLAEEAASLSFERKKRESQNKETSQISLRRVNTLKALSEIFIKKKDQQQSAVIDLKSPQFFVLFVFLCETFKECMENANLDEDAVQVIMDGFQNAVKDPSWMALASRKMRGD
jgi:hypothetical protein